MSLYAVKNDEGEWWDFGDLNFWPKDACSWSATSNHKDAKFAAANHGGRVVELVEAQAKVVVSAEEAEMLKKAKNTTVWRPAAVIQKYAYEHEQQADDEVLLEGRLMRAYVNGWTVEKPKRWNVKVPHTEKTLYRKHDSGVLFASIYVGPQNRANDFLFTLAEIEQYGLGDCERVEVTDDEQ